MTSTKSKAAPEAPDLEQATAHLQDLRARAAAGEPVTAEALGAAEHAVTVAELHAAGVAERQRQAAEAEREARITQLLGELSGEGAADRIRRILSLREQAETAVAKLHAATAEHVGTQAETVRALKRELPEKEASVIRAHDLTSARVRGHDISVDTELPARLVAGAVAFGLPDMQARHKAADKLRHTLSSLTDAADLVTRLRRAAGETPEATGPTHGETRRAELAARRATLDTPGAHRGSRRQDRSGSRVEF